MNCELKIVNEAELFTIFNLLFSLLFRVTLCS